MGPEEDIELELCLPVVDKKDEPLLFRAWKPNDILEEAGFGTQVPSISQKEVLPDCLLVPLLGFNEQGYRLGYGGGFYDRTINKLQRAKDKGKFKTISVLRTSNVFYLSTLYNIL